MAFIVFSCLGEKGNDFKFDKVSLTPSSTFQVLLESIHSESRHVDVPFSSMPVLCGIGPPCLLTAIFSGHPQVEDLIVWLYLLVSPFGIILA